MGRNSKISGRRLVRRNSDREAKLLSRISVNPKVLAGKPTIRGLRISVEHILKALAAGRTPEELLDDYPELELEDIQAALLWAAKVVSEERIYALETKQR